MSWAGLRRHWLITSLVGLGALVRLLVMVAYQPAFWYFGDSGQYIHLAHDLGELNRYRAIGYSVLLAILEPAGSFAVVAGVQHLAGLGLAVAIYVLLVRRGLPRVVASLATVPVLVDALQVDLEHFVLSETLFTVLLVGAVLALLWRERPGPVACAASGLLLAAAWFTRPIALGVVVLLFGYLALRRMSWRQLASFALAFATPWAAIMLWAGAQPNPYGRGSTGLFLYGRTAIIADCDRLVLSNELRPLCPTTPIDPDNAGRADWYIWNYLPARYRDDPWQDGLLRQFAIEVIKQQPGDYAAVVARESAPYFLPWQHLGRGQDVLNLNWTLPAAMADHPGLPYLARSDYDENPADPALAPAGTGLTRALHWYGAYVRTPALLTTAVLLATLASVILALRGAKGTALWRDAWDAGALVAVSVALLVAQVALSMYEPRYGLPTLPLFSIAGALAWRALRTANGSRTGDAPVAARLDGA